MSEQVNVELINLQLDYNKKAIEDLKGDVVKISDGYDKFNNQVLVKMTELDTKVKVWTAGASLVSGTLVGIAMKMMIGV